MAGTSGRAAPQILVIDDDRDMGEVVTAVLSDEGYKVTVLEHISDEAVRAAIGSLEPDCILLDGVQAAEYAEAWATAAEVHQRARPIPTIMFTSHRFDAEEAIQGTSQRAVEAGFSAVVSKPFHIDDLIATVRRAVESGVAFNHSLHAEQARTDELVAHLRPLEQPTYDRVPSANGRTSAMRLATRCSCIGGRRPAPTSWLATAPTGIAWS
jgi:CheY-like chemotaxis protein